jgi:hypothetical protein
MPIQDFETRVVPREYGLVWQTLEAALRNEGAQIQRSFADRGEIDTAYRLHPGLKITGPSVIGERETRDAMVQVRYVVRARSLGPASTEVRLRTDVQMLDRTVRTWTRVNDDGALKVAFWRRFEEDLAYYGVRPERWRPEDFRPGPVRDGATEPGGQTRGVPGGG